MPACNISVDHKKEFDQTVKNLVELRKKIEASETPNEISSLEKDVRFSLLKLVHEANLLGYWMKEAADKRRQELREKE